MISNRYAKCQVHHFFFSEILFRGTLSRAANRSRAKQPSRSPIPTPNSRAVPIVSCTVRRSRSQYRSPVPLVPVHRTSSSSVGHQFVVPGRQQQNPRYRIDEEGVPGRRWWGRRRRFVLSRAASSYCALLRPNARAKLAKEDARCFSYRTKWWRREGKPREGKKKAREVEPRIPWSLFA